MIKLEEHPSKLESINKERLETICKISTIDAFDKDENSILWDDERLVQVFGDFADYFYFDEVGKKYFLYIKA